MKKITLTACMVSILLFAALGIADATMIYSDNDYSCGLENYAAAVTNTNSFEIAMNIAVYAGNGSTNISFYRLVSNGDWNTDYPLADNNLKDYMQARGYTLNLGTATIGVTDLSNINVLFFAGHNSFTYNTSETSALKAYLDNGGLIWIDDCAGSPAVSDFEASFDVLVNSMYGTHLTVLSPDHLLFKSHYNLSGSDFSFTEAGNGTEWAQLPLQGYENHPNQTVPEPATMLLLGFGLVGLAGVRRRFNR
jgi:hypothetical protein